MKTLLATLAVTTALTAPGLALARPVTLTTKLNNYGGNGAYLALYVTDASGAYVGSLWMAGGKSQYYEHLSDWYRATGGNPAQINGITGASVGAGRTLKITLDLADALFDAGYELHIDAAVEDMRDSPSEVVVPLTTAGAGKPIAGAATSRASLTTCERTGEESHDPVPAPLARADRRALLVVLALSGAALSVLPALEALSHARTPAGISVAALAARDRGRLARRSSRSAARPRAGSPPTTSTTAARRGGDRPGDGQGVGTADTSGVRRWLTDLHRSLFLGDAGRIVAAAGAAAMLALSLSGLALFARRAGGWRRLLPRLAGAALRPPARGDRPARRSSGSRFPRLTALWMTAAPSASFPEGPGAPPSPRQVSGRDRR